MANNKEDYLLVTWEFIETIGRVSEKDIARRLKISAPTASEYVSKLVDDGLLVKRGRDVNFTSRGYRKVMPMVREHRIVEVFAYKFLEIPWEDSHSSVMELEHLFHGDKGEKLFKNIGRPETCPHGNPVNPSERKKEVSASLAEPGKYTLNRVSFEDRKLLREMSSVSAFPGASVELLNDGDVTVETANGELILDPFTSYALKLIKV
ncbi:MAG TPA: metal-dependent transcriptional regulator [Thermoplasmataceae archaeon]|nr:metal-dependent transcriptional regulator [Thermoplasmataceae archaeon]